MTHDLTEIAKAYPNLVHLKIIGETAYNRKIYAISIGKGTRSVAITASHHAREWITTCVVMKIIESYCYGYKSNQSIGGFPVRTILDTNTIWFVPMVNPDGVTLQQLGLNAFPNNMHRTFIKWNKGKRDFTEWKANAEGIDLNLQYDGDWRKIKNRSLIPASQGYKGTAPFTANEVKAIVQFLKETNPTYEVAYHASGNIIFSNPSPDKRYPIAAELSALTGYGVASISDSNGGLTDWWNGRMKKIGLTIEVGPFCGEKPVPLSYLDKIWKQNEAVGLYLASRASIINYPLRHDRDFRN